MNTTTTTTPRAATRHSNTPRPTLLTRLVACAAAFLATSAPISALAQDLEPKAPPQDKPIAIIGATVHPITSDPIENAAIIFSDGVIRAIVPASELDAAIANPAIMGPAFSADALQRIDATGKHVYPGLITPWSNLGLTEIGAVAATSDESEFGRITPEACPAIAINPDSTLLPVTRTTGILIAGVAARGGLLPGQVSAVRLEGWSPELMTIRSSCGVVLNWPNTRPVRAWWMDQSEEEQLAEAKRNLDSVAAAFDAFDAYARAKRAEPNGPTDLRWEAMLPLIPDYSQTDDARDDVALPTQRLYIAANTVEQINAAVSFATAREIRVVIVGGREAPLCAPLLKQFDIPVIVLGTHTMPTRDDAPYDDAFTLPKRLNDAGLTWALCSNDDAAHERNLPYQAATAIKFGTPHDAALKAVTINAAKVLGIDDRYGSLEVGKSATLIISDTTPLEITSRISAMYLDGRNLSLETKQTRLAEKYRERYRQTGDIKDDSAK